MVQEGVIPQINKLLAAGLQLPTVPGLTFGNPITSFGDRYLFISTNVSYVPPSWAKKSSKITIL